MKNIVVIGASSGFGEYLVDSLSDKLSTNVLGFGRPQVDFLTDDWVTELHGKLCQRFGTPDALDTIIIPVWSAEDPELQLRVTRTLWGLFRNKKVAVIVLGYSSGVREELTTFTRAKADLRSFCFNHIRTDQEAKARLILLEPHALENRCLQRSDTPHLTFKELEDAMLKLMRLEMPYLQLALFGARKEELTC